MDVMMPASSHSPSPRLSRMQAGGIIARRRSLSKKSNLVKKPLLVDDRSARLEKLAGTLVPFNFVLTIRHGTCFVTKVLLKSAFSILTQPDSRLGKFVTALT